MTQQEEGKKLISCIGKRSFDTKADARAAAREARGQSGEKGIEEYRCKFADHWHIGHRDGRKRKIRFMRERRRRRK